MGKKKLPRSEVLAEVGMDAIEDNTTVRKAFISGKICNYSARTYVGVEAVGCRRMEDVMKADSPKLK